MLKHIVFIDNQITCVVLLCVYKLPWEMWVEKNQTLRTPNAEDHLNLQEREMV